MKDTLGTQTTYPDFVPNQILTNDQLNELREHLDRQDRASRTRLVGMGIICGFEWQVKSGPRRIELEEGLGLTSDGYLACLAKTTLTHVRSYTDPDVEDNGTTPSYEPWREGTNGSQHSIWELLPDDAPQEVLDAARALRASHLQNRVLVLYFELEPVELRSCFVTECDNKGQRVKVNLRALLVPKQAAEGFQEPICEEGSEPFRVPRLHAVTKLDTIAKANHIDAGYRAIVQQQINPLIDHIEAAFERYRVILDLQDNDLEPITNRFKSVVNAGAGVNQYHYDALKDMAAAYNEFVDAACGLQQTCCWEGNFPRHLELGAIDHSATYRSRFIPSAVHRVAHDETRRARKLFLRMTAIGKNIDLSPADQIRLTTSHCESHPLGARAVPHYLPLVTDIEELWQPKMCCTTDKLWSYHDHPHTADDTSDFGFNDYNRASFIRIEGHLGDECSAAHQQILDRRGRHNAEFEVLATSFEDPSAKLDDISDQLDDLLAARRAALDEYNLQVMESVVAGTFPGQDIGNLLQRIVDVDKEILELRTEWALLRCRRELHCDVAHLETMYADLRGELLCLLSGLAAELTRLSDALSPLDGVVPEKRLRLAAVMIDGLHGQLRRLIEAGLPPRLCAFHYPVFIACYKELLHDAGRFWLLWRVFTFPVQPEGLEVRIPRPWPGGAEAISARLLTVARGCFHTRLARLARVFERVWKADPSYFPNLVALVAGLEHLAGVKRCGIFVLVCDRRGANQPLEVRADFALSCRLPCCCDIELDPCLPLVALDQHRVEILEEGDTETGFKAVEIDIDLRAAGYEASARFVDGEPVPALEIKLPEEQDGTPLGGKVAAVGDGVVRYQHEQPRAGMVDSFEYILVSDHPECPGQDVAHVDILMEPRPEEPLEPEPKPAEGELFGHVTFEGEPFTKGAVEIVSLDMHRPLITVPAAQGAPDPGFYSARLFPGNYQARAVTLAGEVEGAPIGEWVEVEISAGERTQQDLELQVEERPGVIAIRVIDTGRQPIKTSMVTLASEDRSVTRTSEAPGAEGVHLFDDLPPGVYLAKASAKGYVSDTIRGIALGSGGKVQRVFTLAREAIRIDDAFVHDVAISRGRAVEEVRIEAEKLYGERYNESFEIMTDIGERNPEIGGSREYRAAVQLMTEGLPSPEVNPELLDRAVLKTMSGLAAKVGQTPDADERTQLRHVMRALAATYFDRVTTRDVQELPSTTAATVEKVISVMRESAITSDRIKESWPAAPIRSLSPAVARRIDTMIG